MAPPRGPMLQVMKPIRMARAFAAASLVVTLGLITAPAGASTGAFPTYRVIELDSPDRTAGAGISVNNLGWVAGSVADELTSRATLWRGGRAHDLGTLGGPNSAVLWPVKNDRGIVVGVAETAADDPRDELWSCFYFFPAGTGKTCRGFVWEGGRMRALGTFGGTHGFAAGANDDGLVVGWAELATQDPTCNAPQVLGFHAAVWDTRRGDRIDDLPPLAGDSASAATAINRWGDVVGISGDCADAVGGFSARHMVMWRNGKRIPLPDFGGEAWNTPMAVNNLGLVVGFANAAGTPGATFNERAFLWTPWGGTTDLGTLTGHTRAQALGINDRGIIVGLSKVTGQRSHAVIWRDRRIADLNSETLTPGYGGHLLYANDINAAGVITGQAVSASGRTVAFVAIPNLNR